MSVEIDADGFLRGLDRLVRDVEAATGSAVEGGLRAIGNEFRSRAVRLSGQYASSWTLVSSSRSSQRVEGQAGPDVPYARKLERRYGAVQGATAAARLDSTIEDAWGRAMR